MGGREGVDHHFADKLPRYKRKIERESHSVWPAGPSTRRSEGAPFPGPRNLRGQRIHVVFAKR